MKKIILLVLAFTFITGLTVNAQDGKKAFKKVKKAFGSYNLDPQGNSEKLVECIDLLKTIPANSETTKTANFHNVKGEVFNAMSSSEFTTKLLKPAYVRKYPNAATEAYMAFKESLNLATKKYHKKEALAGLAEALINVGEEGRSFFGQDKYEDAYNSFNTTFLIHDILKDNGKDSSLDGVDEKGVKFYDSQLFVKILCAEKAGKIDEVAKDIEKLYNEKFDNAHIYSSFFSYLSQTDEDKALEVLSQGRKMYPKDEGLMYAEINYYLKLNKTDLLVDKLKVAIELDPKNASLYSTLGSVHDKIYMASVEAKKEEVAKTNFDLAKANFEKALEIKGDFFDATYSLGALFYNKAASMTSKLNELADDYSKAGMKKYNNYKVEVDGMFATALPYFQKAEKINPKDLNTLIALKEMAARSGDVKLTGEYKARIDAIAPQK